MSSDGQTLDLHVQRALARSGGRPETPASNRHRITLLRVGAKPKNGNHRGENGKAVARFGKSIN